ncbi:hypothetical protein BC941DRAFT_361813 [Chlamydoabsidia padenii]|nr:hypothetical protein BC941DRAFT_361813 [Chlamydoabsidia padenii]
MASNEHCYFQDDIVDDVDVDDDSSLTRITYWDTLYINFLRYPSLIHANIQSSRYIDHYRWRFHNEEINMHAGYADLAFGAIVPRWKAQNFLTQLSKSGLGKERLYEADAYFAIWSNQYPWLLDNPLRNHASLDIMASDGMEQSYLNAQGGDIRRMRYDAARRLHRALQSDLSLNPKDYVDRVEEMPPMRQRDTRASCVTDRCLFFTNIDPIPPHQLDMIPAFDKAKYLNLKDWDTTLDGHLDLPKSIDWVQEGYHSAVDRRNDTCWTMKTNPRMNDYFGLITLGQGLPAQLVISTNTRLSDPSAPLDRLFKISILRNKNHWKACKIIRYSTSTNPISSKPHHTNDNAITDIHFELDCFSDILAITSNTADNDDNDYHQRDVIHSLKAMFLNDWEIPFSVCEILIA